MMIEVRKGYSRGKSHNYWLNSFHTFSFGDYFEPEFMGFSSLRVINEDTVQPGEGFGRHPHKNMEIITYVIEGSLEHKDSMGTGTVIRPGEIQCMSAGTGIQHSEFNHSSTNIVHFLQIWIIPEKQNLKPQYQQESMPVRDNELLLIGAHEGDNIIKINQDVKLYRGLFTFNHEMDYRFSNDRCGWLQLVKGELLLNNHQLVAGDGAAITTEEININSTRDAEFLLFDLKRV